MVLSTGCLDPYRRNKGNLANLAGNEVKSHVVSRILYKDSPGKREAENAAFPPPAQTMLTLGLAGSGGSRINSPITIVPTTRSGAQLHHACNWGMRTSVARVRFRWELREKRKVIVWSSVLRRSRRRRRVEGPGLKLKPRGNLMGSGDVDNSADTIVVHERTTEREASNLRRRRICERVQLSIAKSKALQLFVQSNPS